MIIILLTTSTPVSSTVSSTQLNMFIEEMVAVRSQQSQNTRLEDRTEEEEHRRWQQYNQETLML